MNPLAKAEARKIINYYGITEPDEIDIYSIAIDRNLIILDKKIDGAQGRLLHRGKQGIITVDVSIQFEARRRFIIAHELGHFELHRDKKSINICDDEALLSQYKKNDLEYDANVFAGELLIPTEILNRIDNPKDFSKIYLSNLAQTFNVSLSALSMKYVDEGKIPIAIIYSKNGIVNWHRINKDFVFQFVDTRVKVSNLSSAYDFFNSGQLNSVPEEVPAEAWFANDNAFDPNVYLFEQYQAFPSLNSVLSVIWCK
ncbi:MAG: ImmA/IrrE family metallo-endopeptidase [Bacteroidetes bacterium]|nr:ImmA/IrrE family metallo-endopeptidase [Bacteroidota bacterium]